MSETPKLLPPTADTIDTLVRIVGAQHALRDEAGMAPYLTEWRDRYRGSTPIMVSPATTEQVAEVVRACADAGSPIVPQGGNTGLCGGAIPDNSGREILLSLGRLNKIRSISPLDYSMVAEAGCILATIQSAAAGVGRLFPLSLAPEGSCQIGGNLSTNAGGINVLRYAMKLLARGEAGSAEEAVLAALELAVTVEELEALELV